MTPSDALGMFGEALYLVILLASIVIVPSLLVGLVVSVFQAATQINEQTLSFLPRLLTTLAMIMVAGPWILNQLMDFTMRMVNSMPGMIG